MTKRPAKSEDKIGTQLAALALKILEQASGDGINLQDRLDSFKLLTAYYVGTSRVNAKQTPEEDDGTNFNDFRKRIAAATGGSGSGDSGAE